MYMVEEDKNVKVFLYEISADWMYSNPSKLFNLSLPMKPLRTQQGTQTQTTNYIDFLK